MAKAAKKIEENQQDSVPQFAQEPTESVTKVKLPDNLNFELSLDELLAELPISSRGKSGRQSDTPAKIEAMYDSIHAALIRGVKLEMIHAAVVKKEGLNVKLSTFRSNVSKIAIKKGHAKPRQKREKAMA